VGPTALHESLREALDALAVLAGFWSPYPGALADGRRPDVLRYSASHRLIFLGDAKAMESPNDSDCFGRLASYLRWMRAAAHEPAGGVIAICTPNLASAQQWASTLELVCKEVEFAALGTFASSLGDYGLAWAECGCLLETGPFSSAAAS
jgi:hypothetical protein